MIAKNEAKEIVAEFLAPGNEDRAPGRELVVFDEHTEERDYGWLFNITTADFIRTRNRKDGVVGVGPVLVLSENGSLVRFSSAYDSEEALAAYEADPDRFPVQRV